MYSLNTSEWNVKRNFFLIVLFTFVTYYFLITNFFYFLI